MSELLSPHQTWEYVQRVNVYEMSAHTLIDELRVNHEGRNDDFPLALSSNGSKISMAASAAGVCDPMRRST
jgi:hypothetical protein